MGLVDYRLVPDHERSIKINPYQYPGWLRPLFPVMLSAMSDVAASGPETCATNSPARSLAPEPSRSELFIVLAVFFGTCLYLWPLRDFATFNANEGITLAAAERILHGQVPYRDFFTFVTPGSPYL